jgi:hypothetical protein
VALSIDGLLASVATRTTNQTLYLYVRCIVMSKPSYAKTAAEAKAEIN